MIGQNIDYFKQNFSGEVILPGDAPYEQARTTLTRKGTPAIVLRVRSAADVAATIRYARNNSLLLSVKGGGHSTPGFSTNDGGVVIDLSLLNDVKVIDVEKQIVRIGSGAVWGKVAAELGEYGLALSSGDTRSVGVGGLTLGGGIGWMVRKIGLTIDRVKSAEIVTAEGRTIRVSASENPDLFWAIRGGGGNFGVVTSFDFSAHPVTTVFGGVIMYAVDSLHDVVTEWGSHMQQVSENLSSIFVLMPSIAGNPPMAMAMVCYDGDDETEAMQAIDPMLKFGTVLQHTVGRKQYSEMLDDPHPLEGVKIHIKNGFTKDLNEELVNTIVTAYRGEQHPVIQIRSVGGAMNRVASDATAFAHRSSNFLVAAALFLPETMPDDAARKAMTVWDPISAWTSGAYVNFFSGAGPEEVSASYPIETLKRLSAIKKQYDPQNVFNQNYNIPPAG